MSKPLHPATVHFPLAFILLANGLDLANAFRNTLPNIASPLLLASNDMTRFSYYTLGLGLLTSAPAVVSGGSQALQMFTKQGMFEADGKTLKAKVKTTLMHATVNDVAIALSAYVWYCKYAKANETLVGKVPGSAAEAYAPEGWMLVAQVATMALMVFGGHLGGTLTYNYGVGFSMSGTSQGKKSN